MCLCSHAETIWTQRIVSELYYSVLKHILVSLDPRNGS